MSNKAYLSVTGIIFLVIAILHALRIAYGWHAAIGGWVVPMWLSWVALVVAGYLSWSAKKLMR